jgi:hypothetical protein
MIIAIAHAAWSDERKASCMRLVKSCSQQLSASVVLSSKQREHASVWAPRLWDWVGTLADGAICLNDDVEICPAFYDTVQAARLGVPEELLSLHVTLEQAPTIWSWGFSWVRSYWLTGPAYYLPSRVARELVIFAKHLPAELLAEINEDVVAILWAWSNRAPIYNAIPALVKHDTSVPSTLGYDNLPMRKASFHWDTPGVDPKRLLAPDYWKPKTMPPFVENPWMTERRLRELLP